MAFLSAIVIGGMVSIALYFMGASAAGATADSTSSDAPTSATRRGAKKEARG